MTIIANHLSKQSYPKLEAEEFYTEGCDQPCVKSILSAS